jgi:hypothetical protein
MLFCPAGLTGPVGGSDYEKPQSAYGFYVFFLRHILARRNATHCSMGGPKRHYTAGTLSAILYPKIFVASTLHGA